MKNAYALLLSAAIVLMLSCNDNKPSEPNQPNDTLLVSATIGAGGGALSHEGFELMVPAGAFATSASLKLYESEDDAGFGDHVISPLYRIDGLPETFAESLHVRIACTGAPSEESFALFGDINDDAGISLLPATDSSGTMLVVIPPRTSVEWGEDVEFGKVAVSAGQEDYFAAIANFKSSYATQLFKITYPAYLIDYIDDIVAYIDEAKAAVEGLGMSFDHHFWEWPIELTVKEVKGLSAGSNGRVWFPKDEPPKTVLNEGAITSANLPSVRVSLHRMVMTVAQHAYDDRQFLYPENSWWHYAVQQWFPSVVPGSPAPAIPEKFAGHEYEPFKGLIAGSTYSSDRDHGYGLTSYVRFLEMKFGKNAIGDIYLELVRTESLHSGLLAGAGDDVYNWLPEYFDKLLQGELYNASTAAMAANVTDSYTIDSDFDTLATFYRGCPHLGAQIYRFELDYDSISIDAVLDLSIAGSGINQDYVTLLVYQYKDGAIAYIGAGNDVKVAGLRDLTQAGYDILAVAVNSYSEDPHTGTTAITVTGAVSTPRVFDFNHAEIYIIDITYDCYEEWEDTTRTFENHHGASWIVDGAFTDNTFNGMKTWTSGDYVCSLFVSITVDPVTLDITDFSASERCGQPTYKQSATIQSVPGKPLPFVGSENYLRWYVGATPTVCDYFEYERIIQGFPPQYDHWYQTCNSSTCLDGDPYISVDIYNQ